MAQNTFAAAANTNLSIAASTNTLYRVLLQDSTDAATFTPALYARKNGSGSYTQVPVGATTSYPAPTFVGSSVLASGTGSVTVAIPPHQNGDLLLILVETANQAVATAPGSPFTQLSASPQGTGTAGGTTSTRLTAYACIADGTEAWNYNIGDAGDHTAAVCLAFRGTHQTLASAIHQISGSTASSSTSVTFGSVTTTVNNCLIVNALANATDSTTLQASGWTNSNLTSLYERFDQNVTAGNGGGISVATGKLATAGSSGGTTATLATASVQAFYTIALRPPADVSNEIYISASSYITDGEATTQRMTGGSGSFSAGKIWDASTGSKISVALNNNTEIEWCVQLASSLTAGDYFDLRVYDGSNAISTYTNTGRLTLTSGGGSVTVTASDTNTPTDSAVSVTERLSVATDTNTPTDSAVSVTQRLSVAADTNTPTDSAVSTVQVVSQAADTNTPTDSAEATATTSKVADATDTNTPTDSAVSITERLSVATDTNTPTDSAVSVTERLSVASDTNTPTDSAVSVTQRLSVASDANTPTDSAVGQTTTSTVSTGTDTVSFSDAADSITQRVSTASDSNSPADSAAALVTVVSQGSDTVAFSDSAISGAVNETSAADSVSLSDSAIAVYLPSGVVVAQDIITFSDSAIGISERVSLAVDSIAFSDSGRCVGPNAGNIFTYFCGTAVDEYGRMATKFLPPESALPAEARFLEGVAHDSSGRRYITTWPSNWKYMQGFALRSDGVQIAAPDVLPDAAINGYPVTTRGELAVSNDFPVNAIDGYGLDSEGRLCVTDLS